MKVVIVGGVAGGASAAARIRRLDENAEIKIFERSGYVSYANCGLPYYIGGVITNPDDLTLQTPQGFWDRFRIDVKVGHEVVGINIAEKLVTVKDLENDRIFEESYDKLLLSPGAHAIRPNVPGIDNERIFYLRTVEDTFKIREYVEDSKPKKAVIVGGGFIGLEVAENLRDIGVDVTVLQRPAQLMNILDYDMASMVHMKLRSRGINVKLKAEVTGFEETNGSVKILLKGDAPLTADIVLISIGVSPESDLAKEAGLEIGLKGSIVVNDRMETSVKDVYAVGDVIQVKHAVSGKDAVISLAGPANKQGRIAADNICGYDSRFKGSMASSVIKLFDITAASTGLTEKTAEQAGLEYDRVVLEPMSHAIYYPGAGSMIIKVVFEKTTARILGAQIVGYEGVDKRIDVLATAISAKMTAHELKDLDLSYAPPYSSAKDPVNMAGFMIENIVTGKIKQIHWNELDKLPTNGSVNFLDVRTPLEYEMGHIDGFINIPVDDLRSRLVELDSSKPTYIICHSGLRSYIACRILSQRGFDCYNFSGGYSFYSTVMEEKLLAEQSYPCGMEK
ncbi:MAG: CoA-disulfide reductase [Anaerovoracaceae bacterium]